MRRNDREIININEIKDILNNSNILHLALFDDIYPYIVALHYGYEFINDKLIIYMHCALQGHKLDLIKKNNKVCIEIENNINTVEGDIACKYGSTYCSVVSRGTISILDDELDKIHGLEVLMKHQTGKDFKFNNEMVNCVNVLKFESTNYTCKARRK